MQMRALLVMTANWFDGLLMQMEQMDVSELWKLEFTNDAEFL
jgi:hypothetical protein